MRPRVHETNQDPQSHIPDEATVDGEAAPHAVDSSAVFVVHGIGQPKLGATAAALRSGFEKARKAILEWQREHPVPGDERDPEAIPAPFIFPGYWGDYANIEATFPEYWKLYNGRQREFFAERWRRRTLSGWRTYGWFARQQVRLLSRDVRDEVGVWVWLLYWLLQPVAAATLLMVFVFHPILLTRFLADVRIYLDPGDFVEELIVRRIDQRVGTQLLRMVGLDWDFRPLPENELIDVSGTRVRFNRIVWVAHSLGSVISYNVLSELFRRAADIEHDGDDEQKSGVARFRRTLKRFVTIGSPLDKVAFLYGKPTVRPWPNVDRAALLDAGEKLDTTDPDRGEWWVNFFHVVDPVSGALSAPLICGDTAPLNLHMRTRHWPGWAHVAYWRDLLVVRYVFSRTYGREHIRDRDPERRSMKRLFRLTIAAYVTWLVGLAILLCVIVLVVLLVFSPAVREWFVHIFT
jgi:hypothetical protein